MESRYYNYEVVIIWYCN